MARYIDAEALDAYVTYDRCNLCRKYYLDRDGIKCKYCMIQWFLDAIDRHKTADVVEVVRCKDCKHIRTDNVFGGSWCQFPGIFKGVKENFFCAYGERKVKSNGENTDAAGV